MSDTQYTANLPVPGSPVVDPESGQATQAWWRFFLSLYSRTGGAQGTSSTGALVIAENALILATTANAQALAASLAAQLALVWEDEDVQPQRPNSVLLALALEG